MADACSSSRIHCDFLMVIRSFIIIIIFIVFFLHPFSSLFLSRFFFPSFFLMEKVENLVLFAASTLDSFNGRFFLLFYEFQMNGNSNLRRERRPTDDESEKKTTMKQKKRKMKLAFSLV